MHSFILTCMAWTYINLIYNNMNLIMLTNDILQIEIAVFARELVNYYKLT